MPRKQQSLRFLTGVERADRSAPGFHGKGAQTGGNTEGIPLFYIALDHYKHRAEKEATLQTQVILTELEEGRLHTTTLRVFEPRGTLRIAAVWQLLLQHSTPVSFRRFKNRVLWLSKENSLFILLFSHLIFFFYFFSRCSERLGGWHSTTPWGPWIDQGTASVLCLW